MWVIQTKWSVSWLKIALVAWVCGKVLGCIAMIPEPWGPRVGGRLPNGHAVHFQSRTVGRETDDRLTWVSPEQVTRHFIVDQVHGGFGYVTIRYTNNGDHVWVESDNEIVASIDLVTSDFRAEKDLQHTWATIRGGTSLDAGRTYSILWWLVPW